MRATSVTEKAVDPRRGIGTTPFHAHTLEERPSSDWEPLEKHSEEVAELAAKFVPSKICAPIFEPSSAALEVVRSVL
jgi:hypothetical protein